MKGGLIYRLDFSSGKAYIGLTTQPLSERLKGHRHDALRRSNCAVHRAWRKYGEPRVSVLAVVEEYMLADTERRAIAVFGTLKPGGYNLTPGGEESPARMPEVAAKISAAAKGRKHSPEAIAKRAASLRRTYKDPERRAKLSLALTGRVVSEETKVKQRNAKLGKALTEEHRAKLKIARNKRPSISEETRAKMSAAHKGKVFSEETRAKLRAAHLALKTERSDLA